MYYLKSDQYKKAFAHLNVRQSGAYADIALSKIGEPVPAYFTSYVIYEVKLDIGPDGRIGVYAKLSQDYSNDTYTIKDGTSVGNIHSAFMAPIA